MKTLHSLSDLKKLKIAPAPGGTSTPAKQPAPTEDPPVAPKRTPREEFAALLGDSAPPPAKRGIGQKAPPAQKAPERPQEAPAPRKAPTVRIVGPAGEQALSAGSLAVLQPGDSGSSSRARRAPRGYASAPAPPPAPPKRARTRGGFATPARRRALPSPRRRCGGRMAQRAGARRGEGYTARIKSASFSIKSSARFFGSRLSMPNAPSEICSESLLR